MFTTVDEFLFILQVRALAQAETFQKGVGGQDHLHEYNRLFSVFF